MKSQTQRYDPALLVTILEERFDATCAPAFISDIKEWMADGTLKIVLDFSHVDFMDSTALGAIIKAFKWIRQADEGNGELLLCGLNDKIRSLLQLTRMDRVFAIHTNCKEAIATLTEA